MNKRGFTLIELLTVIAILGILVLLAAPKFLGYTEKANVAKIQTGIKAVETAVDLKSLEDPEFTKNWVVITPDKLQEINDSGKLIDKNGFIKEDLEGGKNVPLKDLDNVKWSSGGEFILAEDGENIYYYNKDMNVSKNPDGSAVNPGDNDGDNSPAEPETPTYPIELPNGDFEQEDGTITTVDGGVRQPDGSVNYPNGDIKDPDGNIIHPDGSVTVDGTFIPVTSESNFTWVNDSNGYTAIGQSEKGYYKYTGTGQSTVVIPYVINGNPMTSYNYMFFGTDVTKVISTNSNVTDMRGMFSNSQATTLDLSSFNTSNVTNMNSMFDYSQATSLDLSSFDTSKVTAMSNMFANSKFSSLDLTQLDTSNVENMKNMFYGSSASSINLTGFNTSKVKDMSQMFQNSKATVLDLRSFNTSNVTTMWSMFHSASATTYHVSTFDTRNVTSMSNMFFSTKAITLDLSSFSLNSISNVETDMYNMFTSSSIISLYVNSSYLSEFERTPNIPNTTTVTTL